ncbi:hypothetical protein B0H98_107129 [Vreelandella songnenensis]|uniref:Uncharacterized protein n=1 Tax=Vreelandella songnenensis TaxID=1176243 RepID=A0A2T0V1E9_9GAMM|nr:hypothetical protein [Halomonas songnenensis]PRY63984.1 hypothetical protein B0H98_107129 [Halomonas songnenensis]
MQSKYKIRLLKANLFAAASILAAWSLSATPVVALALWVSFGWLFITALLLDFSHRYSHGLPWQVVPGALLLGLIATDPQRHSLLVWAWAAVFMLPQARWAFMFNTSAAVFSWVLIMPGLNIAEGVLMLTLLGILGVLALSRARQLVDMNGAIRQRSRLIPGANFWAGEQLLRDLPREQTRAEREVIYAELLVLKVKRRQLWATAKKLCSLTYSFENTYRLNNTTLATLMLSRSPQEASLRRKQLHAALTDNIASHYLALIDIEPTTLTLNQLCHAPVPGSAT